jgi:hypothetical protein
LELANIPLQFVIWFRIIDLPVTAPNIVGFALFAILLVEGTRTGPPSSGNRPEPRSPARPPSQPLAGATSSYCPPACCTSAGRSGETREPTTC